MLAFLVKRIGTLLVVLFCVISITFLLIRIAPGGPFTKERKIPEQIEKALLAKYKLDGTLWQQYTGYIADLAQGDLRLSTQYKGRSVNEILSQTFPVTATLGALAFLLATVGGVTLGSWAALRRGTTQEAGAMFLALLAISIPTFVTGPLLILVFGLKLGWFPIGGISSPWSFVLPSLTLAGPYIAYIARLTRTSLLEVLSADFIRTARAKGVSQWGIVSRHAARVALLPVITFLGPLAAHLLTGSIVVETIFNIPGAGGFFVHSIQNRDGFLLGGVVIIYCVLLLLFNLLVDLTYSWMDRRIKLYES